MALCLLVPYMTLALVPEQKQRVRIEFVLSKDAAVAVGPQYIAAARLLIFIAVRSKPPGASFVDGGPGIRHE